MKKKNELVIFETADNAIKLEVPVEQETVWLSQAQIWKADIEDDERRRGRR